MPLPRTLRHVLLAAALAVPTLALPTLASAQAATTTPANAGAGDTSALRRQARRLTLLNALPAGLRDEASALIDRAEALRTSAATLRTQGLEAYVSALETGSAPAVARVEAQNATADARLAFARRAAALRTDAQAFASAHPEAAALLRDPALRPGADAGRPGGQGREGPAGRALPGRPMRGPARAGPGADHATFGQPAPGGPSVDAPPPPPATP